MSIKYTTTIYKNNKLKTVTRNTFFVKASHVEKRIINVFPEIRYQKIYGFGGAITDSAGYVYSLMSFKNKQKLLKEYYSKDSMNYSLGRIHLDSCDFSTHKYQAIKSKDLDSMDITDTRKHIIPLIHDIQTYTGKPLEILATPWSPPSFLKTTHLRTLGGKLKKSNMEFYAKYLCKYIQELIKEDINITRITIQNEPKAIQTWDSCLYSAEEEKEFIKDYLYPELEKNHLENIDILIHDHNKDSAYDRAKNVITEETKDIIDGVAFHWYTGDHFDALSAIKDQYPDKDLILSEMCVGYSKEDNVLKGQMSLVGPRPYLLKEKKEMGKYYSKIVSVKPGLTGYWQVYGKSDPSFSSRCKLEAYYSNNFSLPMDTKIFFKTFLVILEKRNSN